MFGSSHSEVFLGKGVLKSNVIEIVLRHGCSPVNLLHIFRTPCLKNTSGRLYLKCSESTIAVFFETRHFFKILYITNLDVNVEAILES